MKTRLLAALLAMCAILATVGCEGTRGETPTVTVTLPSSGVPAPTASEPSTTAGVQTTTADTPPSATSGVQTTTADTPPSATTPQTPPTTAGGQTTESGTPPTAAQTTTSRPPTTTARTTTATTRATTARTTTATTRATTRATTPPTTAPTTAVPVVPPTINLPSAPGNLTSVTAKSVIDYSNAAAGYVTLRYTGDAARIIVWITPPQGDRSQYDVNVTRDLMAFPLSRGSGSYKVEVLERGQDRLAYPLDSVTFTASLGNANAPFLMSHYYVNYTASSPVVATAAQLAAGRNELETIEAVYNWFIANVRYDHARAADAAAGRLPGYVPDLNALMRDKKGICFDIASGMAAMLRSRNIPARLEFGRAGTVSDHAWISVWTRQTGWVNTWIRFTGSGWVLMDATFAITANGGDSDPQFRAFMGNLSNFNSFHLY